MHRDFIELYNALYAPSRTTANLRKRRGKQAFSVYARHNGAIRYTREVYTFQAQYRAGLTN
jgi:hypothetical protein